MASMVREQASGFTILSRLQVRGVGGMISPKSQHTGWNREREFYSQKKKSTFVFTVYNGVHACMCVCVCTRVCGFEHLIIQHF